MLRSVLRTSRPRVLRGSALRRDRRALAAVVSLGALGAAAASIPTSGAAFSSQTTNPGNVLAAAADWTPPTVAVADPGSPLRGTVQVGATASDADSGLKSVAVQYAPNAGAEGSYVQLCTSATSPAACTWNTTTVADGAYKVRAVAVDKASPANTATSAVVSQRVVDNTAPTVSLADPGAALQPGPVTLTATAADATSGVARVVLQSAPTGTTTWTDVCTVTTAPYSCTWSAAAGTYDLRAVATDAAGNTGTGATITGRVVKDTVRPTAAGITATNATGGAAGTMQTGDTIVLRYSEPMLLSTVLTGLTETTPRALTVKLVAGGILGSSNDGMTFATSSGTVNLGTVDLGSGNWTTALESVSFAATASARTVGGATEITIVLGTKTQTGVASSLSAGAAVRLGWSPSASATDLAGNAAQTTTFTQAAAAVAF